MVESPDSAILGSAFFPEFRPAPTIADPAVAISSSRFVGEKNDEEVLRKAYRIEYARGYSRSWTVQKQRAASVLQVLRRLSSDIRENAECARHDVETRLGDIAKVVAADLVAEEVAGSGADR